MVGHNVLMFYGVLILLLLSGYVPGSNADQGLEDDSIILTVSLNNDSENCTKCGCSSLYIYDEASDRCLVNISILKRVVVYYNTLDVQFQPEDALGKSIYIEGEKLFKGIMISVMLFMACASVCIVTACIYCCRINYTDRTLKNNIKALAKKLKKDYSSKNYSKKRAPLPQLSESCNVVCEDAGVLVV